MILAIDSRGSDYASYSSVQENKEKAWKSGGFPIM